MKAIRIQNLRSLADTGFIELKPITILLGENASGKSTFLRAFPLLRQSVETATSGPILWYGRLVDFGSFPEALRKGAEEDEIAFHFKFSSGEVQEVASNTRRFGGIGNILYDYAGIFVDKKEYDIEIALHITGDSQQHRSWAKECCINIANEHIIKLTYERDEQLVGCIINGRDLSHLAAGLYGLLKPFDLLPIPTEQEVEGVEAGEGLFKALYSQIHKIVCGNDDDPKEHFRAIIKIITNLKMGSTEDILKHMRQTSSVLPAWRSAVMSWTLENDQFLEVRDLLIANSIPALLALGNAYIGNFAKNNRYIAPIRAIAERYYRLQNVTSDEVDAQGQNLAMVLVGLSETELAAFSAWTEQHFGFALVLRFSPGTVSIKVREEGSDNEVNLADRDFGLSQLLPVLVQLWLICYKPESRGSVNRMTPVTFTIEQPEIHLHATIQSRLLDLFIHSIKAAREQGIDLRLILETHSETFVNMLGHRVHDKKIDYQDITVVLFDKPAADEPSSVSFSSYDSQGYLVDWPFGFFEPANI